MKTAKAPSEIHPVPKTAVWRWIEKVEVRLPNTAEEKQRNIVLIGEVVIKSKWP